MLRKLSVRGKIFAALAVPVLVLCLAASVFSFQAFANARVASQAEGVVDLIPDEQAVIDALADERRVAVQLALDPATEDSRAATQAATDQAAAVLTSKLADLAVSELDPSVQTSIDALLAALDTDLPALRESSGRGVLSGPLVSDGYTAVTDKVLGVPTALSATLTDRTLAMNLDAYVSWQKALDQARVEGPLVQNVLNQLVADAQDPTVPLDESAQAQLDKDIQEVGVLIDGVNAARANAQSRIDALGDDSLRVPNEDAGYVSLRRLLSGGERVGLVIDIANTWPDATQEAVDSFTTLETTLSERTLKAASDETSARQTTAIYTLVGTVLTVLLSVAIAIAISRRITTPLRRLTVAASEVRAQLPALVEQVSVPGQGPELTLEPIKVESNDEVGQLAAAFNDVNTTTLEVAKEQAALRGSIAEMFVNVARRDHVLLNRQLSFLDELERSEEDANTLANLFRLDHLATRMRRNSESLLVLAGIDSGRRVRQPMPISDVVRTASSEIELYDRVRLNLEADPLMRGHNALNAAHLLAELLENATMFSEPNTPVEVTTTRSQRFVTVEVRDHGIGMTDADFAAANTKVASRSASDVISVQRLGLFVVGRLAERLGAHVVFGHPVDGSEGTVATVALPIALFVDESEAQQDLEPEAAVAPEETPGWNVPEPEPEVGIPFDLNALTDGATAVGMPRRRTSTPEPVSQSTSDEVPNIVLPPLEAANPAIALSNPSDLDWAPAQNLAETLPSSLPSRARGEAPAVPALEPLPEAPPVDGERRSAMFSSFRTLGANESPEDLPFSSEIDEDTQDRRNRFAPPAPVVVPELEPDEPWRPEAAETEVIEPVSRLRGEPLDERTAFEPERVGAEDEPVEPEAVDGSQDEPVSAFEPVQGFEQVDDAEPTPAFTPEEGFAPQEAFEPLPTFTPQEDFEPLPSFQAQGSFEPEPTFVPEENFEPLPTFTPQEDFEPLPSFQAPTSDAAAGDEAPYAEQEPMYAPTPTFSPELAEGAFYQPVQAFEDLESTARPAAEAPAPELIGPMSDAATAPPTNELPTVAAYPMAVTGPGAPLDPEIAFVSEGESVWFPPTAADSMADTATPARGIAIPDAVQAEFRATDDVATEGFGPATGAPAPADEVVPETFAPAPNVFTPAPDTFASAMGSSPAPEQAAMPTFNDVVSDAPTRRSARQSEPVKRGLFGRKKRKAEAAALAAQASVEAPSTPAFPDFNQPESAPTRTPIEAFQPLSDEAEPRFDSRPGSPFAPQEPVSAEPSAWTPSVPAAQAEPVHEEQWTPPAVAEAPVPLGELPLSGHDSGESWTPPAQISSDMSSMLAMRSNIQEQALAELSQLSAYRPAAVETSQGGGLTRRTRGEVAKSTDDLASQKISRDAAELRSRLSAFQSATTRGRQVPDQDRSDNQGPAAESTTDGTDTPHVPDSAPRSR